MALYTSTTNVRSILPDEYGPLLVQPMFTASVAAQVCTVATTAANHYRIPIVTADPTASWTNEGDEITPTDSTVAELIVAPAKVAGLTIISRELADDSSPAAAQIVGEGIARDIARRVDQAFFAGLSAPAPAGLATLSGVQTVVSASAFANIDFAAQVQSKIEAVFAHTTAFITSPATALALATIKTGTGFNALLLGADPSSPTSRSILGTPLYVSQYVAANTLWGLDGSRTYLVLREGANVVADRSAFFTSDRVAVRGTMRIGFAFPHSASTVKVTTS